MEPTPVRSRRHLDDQPHMVYEFYNRDGDAVYVGCTSNLADRLQRHQRSQMWGEVVEVHTAQPRWNLTHTEAASEAARERWRRRKAAISAAS